VSHLGFERANEIRVNSTRKSLHEEKTAEARKKLSQNRIAKKESAEKTKNST